MKYPTKSGRNPDPIGLDNRIAIGNPFKLPDNEFASIVESFVEEHMVVRRIKRHA